MDPALNGYSLGVLDLFAGLLVLTDLRNNSWVKGRLILIVGPDKNKRCQLVTLFPSLGF